MVMELSLRNKAAKALLEVGWDIEDILKVLKPREANLISNQGITVNGSIPPQKLKLFQENLLTTVL
jgi:hypothetical protein